MANPSSPVRSLSREPGIVTLTMSYRDSQKLEAALSRALQQVHVVLGDCGPCERRRMEKHEEDIYDLRAALDVAMAKALQR